MAAVNRSLLTLLLMSLVSAGALAQEDDDDEIIILDDDEDALVLDDEETAASVDADESNADETLFDDFVNGNWLDPKGAWWAPRRGARTELAFSIGGEAGLGEISPNEGFFPTVGGLVFNPVARYYPVDQVAILAGTRMYVGLSAPAAGTTAATVITPYFGVRYELVGERRFSLLADVISGPTAFVFADLTDAVRDVEAPLDAAWAIGAEAAVALAARYTLGPFTLEGRILTGGRGGSARAVGGNAGDVGPFSALYLGLDMGVTWSFWADDVENDAESPTPAEP